MIWSPSTIWPFSSTAIILSPSPSKAKPKSLSVSKTVSANFSGCVEPHCSLMLYPSGLHPIVSVSASKSPNKNGASDDVEPLAPSKAILSPSKLTSTVDFK